MENWNSVFQFSWVQRILKMQMYAITSEEAPIPEIDAGQKQT